MIYCVCGVSGSGKSTIADKLSSALHIDFVDGDSLHPFSNIMKMKNGLALTDEDRQPWFDAIINHIQANNIINAVLACSALKEQYRLYLSLSLPIHFIYLKTSQQTIVDRVRKRENHFLKVNLVESQFATLQEPTASENSNYTVSVVDYDNLSIKDCIAHILEKIQFTEMPRVS